jgi:hypothetical protein
MLFFVLISLLIVLGIVFALTFLYIASRMRFVLFDSVVERECHIRQSWQRRGEPGFRFFIFQLLFAFVSIIAVLLLAIAAALIAFGLGLLSNPREHLLGLVLCAAVFIGLLLIFGITAIVITVLVRDFVIPQMAIENVTVMEGWRRLWSMMQSEAQRYAGYLGLKVLLSISTSIVLGIIGFVVFLGLLIPFGALGVAAVFGGSAAGMTWNLYTIAAAVIAVGVFLTIVFCLMSFISVPLIVFFPAYSIHFFADRYPPLARLIHPPLPPLI